MTSNPPSIMISGGGTGGHIFPALAIAQEFHSRHPQASIRFVGAEGKMEMEKIPEAGYPIDGLWISGLQRKLTVKNLALPFKLLSSYLKARKLLKTHRPQVVVGTGGYASGLLLYAAQHMGIPTLIQEQNSYPGITNKRLAPKARVICAAYPETARFFPKDKLVITGNPLRKNLLGEQPSQEHARAALGLTNQPVLLILGGSLGARNINKAVDECAKTWAAQGIQVIWQCGKLYQEQYQTKWENHPKVRLLPFIKDMELVYAAADLVISRAGASTLSELAVLGKPALLIPSPNVAEDHQTHNAKSLADSGGAILLPEVDLDQLGDRVSKLLAEPEHLAHMATSMKSRGLPNATKDIVDQLEKLL